MDTLYGIGIGMVFSGLLISFIGGSSLSDQARAKIEACEKDLPRSQHCVIIAVPATTTNQEDSTND